jgi:hypothetical protein
MSAHNEIIPVVLFAYARPAHLARVLACLRENSVPLIHAFADGPKGAADAAAVAETRALLRAIDWCEVRLTERAQNFGLGRNVLAGVSAIAAQHEAFIVWEDDLVCVPRTYAWMCAALRHYAGDGRVMSVTAWTHPRVMPPDVSYMPYFDARADSWAWGSYARAWRGMEDETALEKMIALSHRGILADTCGADLPEMARAEGSHNLWAVRWLYHHLQHNGLCLRPSIPMVDHVGVDAMATNAAHDYSWGNLLPRVAPLPPEDWPAVRENAACRALWQATYVGKWRRRWRRWLSRFWGPSCRVSTLS